MIIGTPTGRAPAMVIAPAKFGQAGRRDQHLVAVAREHAEGDLHRRHAAGGDEEALGIERLAVDPLVVAGDGLAQFGDAALIGVEGLALRQRLRRRLADEGRRRQVALADPERDDAGLAARP